MGCTDSDGKTQARVKVTSTAQPAETVKSPVPDGVSQVLPKLVAPVFVAAISWENFLLNISNHTVHDFTCASPELLFLVTLGTMLSVHRLCEVACPLAAFDSSHNGTTSSFRVQS